MIEKIKKELTKGPKWRCCLMLLNVQTLSVTYFTPYRLRLRLMKIAVSDNAFMDKNHLQVILYFLRFIAEIPSCCHIHTFINLRLFHFNALHLYTPLP